MQSKELMPVEQHISYLWLYVMSEKLASLAHVYLGLKNNELNPELTFALTSLYLNCVAGSLLF